MSTMPIIYQPTADKEVAPGIYSTAIDGLLYIEYKKFHDDRGFFADVTGLKNLSKVIGRVMEIKQINLAASQTNVIRGMHAEGWNKLVTTFTGKGFSALADIRPNSPTFKQVEYFLFDNNFANETGTGLYVPTGVANSVCALEGPLLYHYAVDAFYEDRDLAGDKAISIFDPELNLQWPIDRDQMIISQRDKDSITLAELLKK
ncbi:MAG: dTDP-4-dehydrorhamnose 3,5-epimerase family protein [Candidatus Pacebacteria bacterium]|nr:dTDP-4-dehydrorhamnose 3,5-epimerase family protein [Candidatus Paceibacterota bacterium]